MNTKNKDNEPGVFVRTKHTPGRKPQLPCIPKNERRREQKRNSYHKCKNSEANKKRRIEKQLKRDVNQGEVLFSTSLKVPSSKDSKDKAKAVLLKKLNSSKVPSSKDTASAVSLKKPNEILSKQVEEDQVQVETEQVKALAPIEKDVTASEKKFRISAKRIFLTYSRVHQDVTLDEFINILKSNFQYFFNVDFLVSQEDHEEEKAPFSIHYHALIVAEKKLNIRNTDMLKVSVKKKDYRPHYQGGVNDLSRTVEYITKNKKYKSTNPKFFEKLKPENKNKIRDLVAKGEFTGKEAIDYINENPKSSIGEIATITRAFDTSEKVKKFRETRASVPNSPHTLEDFNISEDLRDWLEMPDDLKPTLVLVGSSGSGKSRFARALAKEKDWNTISVNLKDGLRSITPEHKLVILEDYVFKEKDEELLALFTREQGEKTQHRVLYGVVHIGGDQLVICTMNYESLTKLQSFFTEDRFSRRIQVEHVEKGFLKEAAKTINININGDVNIYNLSEMEKKRMQHNKAVIDNIIETVAKDI